MSIDTKLNRRNFLKISSAAGGGLLVGFNWFQNAQADPARENLLFEPNAFIKIQSDGTVTLMAPNPEVGQNIKVALPMIVAEELDVDWKKVKIEQAPLDTQKYERQVAGGSGSIRHGWDILRKAGATAREILKEAAAKEWNTSVDQCDTSEGMVHHKSSGKSLDYGLLSQKAANIKAPEDAAIREPKDFKIIGKRIPNVDNSLIVTGKLKYGLDTVKEGMLVAMVKRPPAFGKKLKSYDDSATKSMDGVEKVVQFEDKIAVLGKTYWQVKKALDALKVEWEDTELENTSGHFQGFEKTLKGDMGDPRRKDGDVEKAMAEAKKTIDITFEIPFLPHAPLEPMNFYADVKANEAYLYGPTQTPARTQNDVSKMLDIPKENIRVEMTRIGGGFGRRLMSDYATEAAMVSHLAKSPVKVIWTREDDMQGGFYRPAGLYHYRASIDQDNNFSGWHLKATAINTGNGTRQNNFPAGAVPNYQVDYKKYDSNISVGPWRAPTHNFIAFTEESVVDEIAHAIGKDPVQFRLDLLEQARNNPAGKVGYDVDRYKKVVEVAAEKSGWGNKKATGKGQGFGAHFSFGSYVAQVANVTVNNGKIKVDKVICVVDCGIVINKTGAENQLEGGIIDGLGHAMFGELTINNGVAQQANFDRYRLIKMAEAPEIEIHFIENNERPEGLGEPGLPPTPAAVANAVYDATGVRIRKMPFVLENLS